MTYPHGTRKYFVVLYYRGGDLLREQISQAMSEEEARQVFLGKFRTVSLTIVRVELATHWSPEE